MMSGKVAIVAGFGDVGKGSATSQTSRSQVMITETDPICALQAAMEGYEVVLMNEAIKVADIVVTATGNKDIVTADHMRDMKDRAILCNIGHFDIEIQVEALRNYKWNEIKPQVQQNYQEKSYFTSRGQISKSRLCDWSPKLCYECFFYNQVIAQIELWNNSEKYEKVYVLPKHLDEKVAMLHLDKVGAKLKCQKNKQITLALNHQGHLNQILIATKLVANDY